MFYYRQNGTSLECVAESGYSILSNGQTNSSILLESADAIGNKTIIPTIGDPISCTSLSFPMDISEFLILGNTVNPYWKTHIEIDETDTVTSTIDIMENGSLVQYTGYCLLYKITTGEPTLIVRDISSTGKYYAIKYYYDTEWKVLESLVWEYYEGTCTQQTIETPEYRIPYSILKEDDTTDLSYTVQFDVLLSDVYNTSQYYKNDSFVIDTFDNRTYDSSSKEFTFYTKRNFGNLYCTSSYENIEWVLCRSTFETSVSKTFHKIKSDLSYTITSDNLNNTGDGYLSIGSATITPIVNDDVLTYYADALEVTVVKDSGIQERIDMSTSFQAATSGNYAFKLTNVGRSGESYDYISESEGYIMYETLPTPLKYYYYDWATDAILYVVVGIQYDIRVLNSFIYTSILNSTSYQSHKIEVVADDTVLHTTTKQNCVLSSIQESYVGDSFTYDDGTICPNFAQISQFTDIFRCEWLDGYHYNPYSTVKFNYYVKVNSTYYLVSSEQVNLDNIVSSLGSCLTKTTVNSIPLFLLNCTLKSDTIGDDNVILLDEDIVSVYDFEGRTKAQTLTNKVRPTNTIVASGVKAVDGVLENEWIESGTLSIESPYLNMYITLYENSTLTISLPNTTDGVPYDTLTIDTNDNIVTVNGTSLGTNNTLNMIRITTTAIYCNENQIPFTAQPQQIYSMTLLGKLKEIRNYANDYDALAQLVELQGFTSPLKGEGYYNDGLPLLVNNRTHYTFASLPASSYGGICELYEDVFDYIAPNINKIFFIYGKFQKAKLTNRYHKYGRQMDRTFTTTTTQGMELGRPLHPMQQLYIQNGGFDTKKYSFRLYLQQGTINHLAVPLTLYEGTLVYDWTNLTPEYVGLIYLKDIEGNDKYDIYKDASSTYKKNQPVDVGLCIWGDEIVEIAETAIPIEEDSIIVDTKGAKLGATDVFDLNQNLFFDNTVFTMKPYSIIRNVMLPQHHIPFEYIRSVVDLTSKVVAGQTEDKIISEEGDYFKTTTSNGTYEILDDYENWSKFNPNRLYKVKKNDAVYLFEGNRENYLCTNISFINETIVEEERIVLNTQDKISAIGDTECTILGNTQRDFAKHTYFNETRSMELTPYTNSNIADIIDQVNNVGIRTYFDKKETLVYQTPMSNYTLPTKTITRDDILLDSFNMNTKNTINYITLDHVNRFPIATHLTPTQISINHTLLDTNGNFQEIVLYTPHNSFNKLLVKSGDRCVLLYEDYEFNCKLIDNAIDPYQPDYVKLTIAAGYDNINYYNGYMDELLTIFTVERTFLLNIGVEYDQVVYQWQIGDSYTNLRYPILPQEKHEVIATLSSPESDQFTYSGYIKDMDSLWETFHKEKEFVYETTTQSTVVDGYFTSNYIRQMQDITQKPYCVYYGDLDIKIERDKDIKITFFNPSAKADGFSITPVAVVGSIMYVNIDDYNKITVNDVLKIDTIYDDSANDLYGIYTQNREYKYIVTGKVKEPQSQYITLNRTYPTERNVYGEFLKPVVYTEYTTIDHFHIRGNSIIDATEKYELKDLDSIANYGENTYTISNKVTNGEWSKQFATYLSNVYCGGYMLGDDWLEVVERIPIIVSFKTHKSIDISVGDIITIKNKTLDATFTVISKKIDLTQPDEFKCILTVPYGKYNNPNWNITQTQSFSSSSAKEYLVANELRTLTEINTELDTEQITGQANGNTITLDNPIALVDESIDYTCVSLTTQKIRVQYVDSYTLYTTTSLSGRVGLYKEDSIYAYRPTENSLYVRFNQVEDYVELYQDDILINTVNPVSTVVTWGDWGQIPVNVAISGNYTIKTPNNEITFGDVIVIR